MNKIALSIVVTVSLVCVNAVYAAEGGTMDTSVYSEIAKSAPVKGGVKQISYDQFMTIRNFGQNYILIDVLSPDSYAKGHIKGARSFPLDTINKDTASAMLSKDSETIVYCGSFHCGASTAAAKKLLGLGYKVLDYKGGLEEWQEKGNKLVTK